MKVQRIIDAWKDEERLTGLRPEERAVLPANPAGLMTELTPEALAEASGGSSWACITTSSWVCGVIATVTICDETAETIDGWIDEIMDPSNQSPHGGAKTYCFAAQTPVRTPQGSMPIAAIQPGDQVLAFDQDQGAVREARVAELQVHEGRFPLFDLSGNGDRVRVTAGHRFHDRDGWRPVEAFSGQEQGLDARERAVRFQLEPSRLSSSRVYNLRVEGLQTYFVGKQELLVRDH